MQSRNVKSGEVVNGYDIANYMCDTPFFADFKNYVKFSCIKILDEHRDSFLNEFVGSGSVDLVVSKSKNYERARNICVNHVKACKPAMLDDAQPAKKNQCTACQTVAADFHRAFQAHNATSKAGKRLPASVALGNVCRRLGNYHQPYIWLEEYCDEVTEDRGEQIADILRFREKVARTGMNPTTSVAEDICKELHPQCYSGDKKKTKKVKSKSKTVDADAGEF